MSSKDREAKVNEVFLTVFPKLPKRKFSLTLKQDKYPGWDSFGHLELISKIEQTFGVNFTFEESVQIESASDVLKLLNQKLR